MERHLMIDIETLGTSSRAPVVAFGAVFLPDLNQPWAEPPVSDTFYMAVAPPLSAPYEPDFGTVRWWMQQSDAARALFRDEDPEPPAVFCHTFLSWWKAQTAPDDAKSVKVWAKPPRFDIAIFEHMLSVEGHRPPWGHRNVLDMRTLTYFADPEGKLQPPDNEGHHNALSDALWQAHYLHKMLML